MKKMSNLSIVNTDYIEKKLREQHIEKYWRTKDENSSLYKNIPNKIKIKLN